MPHQQARHTAFFLFKKKRACVSYVLLNRYCDVIAKKNPQKKNGLINSLVHREDVLPLKAAWQHVRASMRERVANSKKRRGSLAALAPEIEPEIEYLSGLKFRESSVANSTCRGRQAIKALLRL
jgi:hypothetical protein